MYGPNTATENRSTLATDSTISRLSPVSRLILSILSVRASHQYNVFSWKVIWKFISQSKPPRHFSYYRDEVGGTVYRRGEAGERLVIVFVQMYLIVNGNSVGPHDAWVDQGNLVWTVQTGAADAGVLAPFSPEEIPGVHSSIQFWSSPYSWPLLPILQCSLLYILLNSGKTNQIHLTVSWTTNVPISE